MCHGRVSASRLCHRPCQYPGPFSSPCDHTSPTNFRCFQNMISTLVIVIYSRLCFSCVLAQYEGNCDPNITTGNREFAVCLNVCRVLFLGHTVNRTFAVRRELNTRRTESTRRIETSPCAPGPTHGESRLRRVPIRQPTAKWAPR